MDRILMGIAAAALAGPGAAGVWTKADGVTAFDDFAYGPAESR